MVMHSGMMKMMKEVQNKGLRRMVMKRHIMVVALVPLLVIALAGISQAWQGKMDDPYGLLQDESDFLTHPSKIAQGEGIRFYGDYRFTYTDVIDWDYGLDRDEDISGTDNVAEYELTKDLDTRGGEAPIAYRQEEHENWQQSNLDGDGERETPADNVLNLLKMDKVRIEWSTGGGVSLLFDL